MDLDGVTTEELVRRLNGLAVEYDQTVKQAMQKLAKVDNLRREIEPLAAELAKRNGG